MIEIVIGGEGFIGSHLVEMLGTPIVTAHKLNHLDGRWPFDMLLGGRLPAGDIVYLCAGVNGALTCARDPQTSFRTNVDGTINVANHYKNSFVVWISSTTAEWCAEHYGQQKRITETVLRTMPHVGIVRAGRVTSQNVTDLCRTMIDIGRNKRAGVVLWGEDEKPYEKAA